METFIISYEIPDNQDSQALIDKIKTYRTWAHITHSTWAILSDSSAIEVRNTLNEVLPSGGRLIVIQSANNAAWNNVLCTNEWLQKNI